MQATSARPLPWWTWFAPLLVCFTGSLIALNFQIAPYISMVYWPVALGLVMSIWWGPRAFLGLFLSSVLTIGLWQGTHWQTAPAYALCDSLAAAAGWFVFVKVFRAHAHLPTTKDVILFTTTAVGVVGLLKAGLTTGLMLLLGDQTSANFSTQGLLIWYAVSLDFLLLGAPLLVFATPWLEQRGWTLRLNTQFPELLLSGRNQKAQMIETVALFIILVVSCSVLPFYDNWIIFSLLFFWATLRFGFSGAILANFISQLLVIVLPTLFPAIFFVIQHPEAQNYAGIALNLIVIGYPLMGIGRLVSNVFDEIQRRTIAEEALRKTNRLHQALLEKSSEVISIITPDGGSIYVSPSVEDVRGYSPSEIMACNIRDWIHPDDRRRLDEGLRQVMAEQASFTSIDLRVLHKNGSWIWVEIHARNLSADPHVGGIVVNYRDITENRRAQDLVVRQRDLGQALAGIHNLDDGLALCLNTAIELSGMDSGAIYLFDRDQQVLDLHISRGLGPNFVETIHSYSANSPQVSHIIENQPIFIEYLLSPSDLPEYIRQEGSRCIAVIPLFYIGTLLGSLNVCSHQMDEISANARAVAESIAAQMGAWILRLQAGEALQKSSRNLEDSLEVSRMAYWEYEVLSRTLVLNDLFFQMIESSAEAAGGYHIHAKEFVQRYIAPTMAREFLSALIQAVNHSEPGQQLKLETKLILANGRKFWIACWFRVEKDLRGRPVRLLGLIQDISIAKQAEAFQDARLRLIDFAETHSIMDLCQSVLDELGTLTESPLGFYHFVQEDQKTLSLQAWSTRTVEEFCLAQGSGTHYDIDAAGVWADCLRQRRAVVHNNYPALPAARRKGVPPGHAEILRELIVPIFRHDKVVAILGVGNKPFDYNDADLDLVRRFADLTWDITARRRSLEALQQRTQELGLLVYAASELSRSLDLDKVCGELYRSVSSAMPCTSLFISTFEPKDRLIRCASAWQAQGELDVSAFPPIPLEEEGKGTQSLVIRTGTALLLNDYEAHLKTAAVSMFVEDDSRLVKELAEDEARPRSALIVPLLLENQVVGVIQVFSDQLNVFTDDHLRLLTALSNHASIAMANSKLYSQAQNELEERRRAEEALRAMLDEKNVLIKEIHHRVKNNMQVMISLLSLQSAQIADQKIRALIQESENRIRSMALVHEQLYQSSSLSQINFGMYLESLSRDLSSSFDFRARLRMTLKVTSVTLPLEKAVPCGLIVNEMVTNAFKHAFPADRGGSIEICLREEAGEVAISVADDGVGIPPEVDLSQLNSLGMKLIFLLANQINARILVERSGGMKFSLYFKA